MRVKICGLSGPDAVAAAVAAGADDLGFVFFAASPRHVTPQRAASFVTGTARRVGVFVEPANDAIAAALSVCRLDVLQIYAAPARAAAIRARFGLPVWRAVPVSDPADLPLDPGGADALLIEPRPPAGADRPGGHACLLDWGMLAGWRPDFPWVLAGGLTPGNVAGAIGASCARAVDVSSGVESAPGVKSPALIREFVRAARAAAFASADAAL